MFEVSLIALLVMEVSLKFTLLIHALILINLDQSGRLQFNNNAKVLIVDDFKVPTLTGESETERKSNALINFTNIRFSAAQRSST